MQKNEFENRIRETMDELEFVPRKEVWENVSANIDKEKKRRRFLFLFFAFTLLISLAGSYYYINERQIKPPLSVNNDRSYPFHVIKKKGDYNQQQVIASEPANKADNKINIATNKQAAILNTRKTRSRSYKQLSGIQEEFPTKVELKSKENFTLTKLKGNFSNKNAEAKYSIIKDGEYIAEQKNKLPIQDFHDTLSTKEIAVNKAITEAQHDTLSPSLAEKKQEKKKTISISKKWKVGFTFFSGISANISSLPQLYATNDINANSSASTSQTGFYNYGSAKQGFKSSVGYGAGVYIERKLSKNKWFSAGLNYHFQSAISYTGNRISASRNFYDSTLQTSKAASEYFANGNTVKYNNKYHLIELPLNILIGLNKNHSKQILLTAGITSTYLFASKALYLNRVQNVSYAENAQFKKLLFTGQAGVLFKVINAQAFSIAIGPEVQYMFSNMAKAETGMTQHLMNGNFKINITLK